MNILIPTDFSKCARVATDYAVQFAIQNKANITLLHTFILRYTDNSYFIDFDLSLQEVAKKQLRIEKHRILEKFPELDKMQITTLCEIGGLVENIELLEKKSKIDLVIMGTKGVTGWDEIFLGSEAASVVANITLPILLIPVNVQFTPIYNFAFPIKLNEKLNDQQINMIKLFVNSSSTFNLFHSYEDVLDIDDEAENQLTKYFQSTFPQSNIQLETQYDQSLVESVELYLEKIKADFVIAKKQQKNFLQRIFSVSVTETLTFHAKYPLLIFTQK